MNRAITSFLALAALSLLVGCQSANVSPAAPGPTTQNQAADVNTRLGIGYLQAKQYDQAWKRLRRAIDADPDYSTAHNAMGLLYERLNQPEKAEEHFAIAVRLNPSDSAAQTNFGSFLCQQGRYEEGEKRFQQAVKNSLYQSPERAYANAGLCAMNAGESERAEAYFRSALQIDPKIPPVLYNMAEFNFDQERYLPARAYLQRYLEVGPHTARSLWLGIRIERYLGDKNTASSYAMLLRNNYPDSDETQLMLESEAQ